jgi:hypothetical protein
MCKQTIRCNCTTNIKTRPRPVLILPMFNARNTSSLKINTSVRLPQKATKYLLFHIVQPQPPPFHVAKRQPPHRKSHNSVLPSSVHIINSFPVYQPKSYLLLPIVNLNTKLTMTAAKSASVKIVGPRRSSKPPCPRMRMLLARQWNVKSA